MLETLGFGSLASVIDLSMVRELRLINEDDMIQIGSSATYSELEHYFEAVLNLLKYSQKARF